MNDWEGQGCIPPRSRHPQHRTLQEELEALDHKLAFIEQGLEVYFGVNSQVLVEMKEEAKRLRVLIEEAKSKMAEPRTTELL